jgi:hypothetical protein
MPNVDIFARRMMKEFNEAARLHPEWPIAKVNEARQAINRADYEELDKILAQLDRWR